MSGTGLRAVQVALNSSDVAATLRLYSEAFGFSNAGAQAMWGETMRIQALPPDSRALLWWLVGRQEFFQLEIFHHTRPEPRPLPADWRPCDLGWVRIGIDVPDFDVCLAKLEETGIRLLGTALSSAGRRRAAVRDPYAGIVVEVREQDRPGLAPAVIYAATSVSDLEGARVYYRDLLGLPVSPLEDLHDRADEALWGLAGAERDGFLARAGEVWIEVVRYAAPVGRPRPADYRCSDQGIPNVALGSSDPAIVVAAFARLRPAGLVPPYLITGNGVVAGYIVDPEREVELVGIPKEFHANLGFSPAAPFFA